ncbi:MAG TPA: ribonuclease domain-containing protein [Sphingobacterium sp.]|nr:ribonuclease domain-containing protein [Sphingobacterium sp.]
MYRIFLLLAIIIGFGLIYYTQDDEKETSATAEQKTIDLLTEESVVIAYLKEHQKLPDYYINKKEAKQLGWIPSKGNLCEVLPGKAIGGDYFGNFEGNLPMQKGRKYYEADINYNCGRRGAERIVFSNDGLIYITKDHYNSFEPK